MIEQQDPLYAAQAELRHMKQTVAARRDELEHAQEQSEQAVQHAVSSASSETAQLKMTITALRDELDESHASRGKAVRKAHAADEDELEQMKAHRRTLGEQ